MTSRRVLSPVVIPMMGLTLALAGCFDGGGGGGGGSDPAPSESDQSLAQVLAEPLGHETACPELRFSGNSGVPGDEITVTGLPSEMDTISFRVIAESDSGETLVDPLFVKLDDDTGETRFAAPVHPSGDPEGGEVQLEPGDGDLHCPKQTFMIEPLPSAPRDYPVTIAEDLEVWVDEVLQSLGYDPATILNADSGSIPENRWNLWLAKQFVSSDRENALPALAEEARDADSNLVARLLMASGLEQELDRALSELASTQYARLKHRSLNPTTPLSRSDTSGIVATSSDSVTTSRFSPNASCESQSIAPDELEINSTEELSSLIQSAQDGSLLSSDASGRAGQVLGGAGLALSGTAGDAAGHAGTAHFVATTVDAAKNALKPQEITEFEVDRADREWVEDRPEDELLIWEGATVEAKGSSINVSEITLQSLVTAGGMASGPIGTAISAASTVAPDAIDSAIEELTGDSCVRIRAPEYGPFDVNDEQWTKAEILGSTVELAGDGHRQYRGVDIGRSELRISLREEPFALLAPLQEDFTIDVVRVNTSLSPSSAHLTEPGELVTLKATATNSYQDLNQTEFTAELLPGSLGSLRAPGEEGIWYAVDYNTPDDRDAYPTYVEFTAEHPTLPSGTGRTYEVEVDIGGDLSINERNVCLNPGQDASFSATMDGFTEDNQTVNWSASAGTISSTDDLEAAFQAPSSTGSVDITATADADSDVDDTLSVTVSEGCIRKLWVPFADIQLDGSGSYPDEANSCGTGENDDTQVERLRSDDPPMSLEALLNYNDYWYSRTESASTAFSHTSTRHHYDRDNDECLSEEFAGTNNTTLTYDAEEDGRLSASLDSEIQIHCNDYGDGTVECVGAQVAMDLWGGAYIVELNEERSFTLEGELSCTNLQGSVGVGQLGGIGLTATVNRFEDGEPWFPEYGSTGVENPDGTLRVPQLFDVSCDTSNSTVTISEDFVLTEPPNDAIHEVVIVLQGQLQAVASLTGDDNFGTTAWTQDLPEPGFHTTNADINFSVKLSPD